MNEEQILAQVNADAGVCRDCPYRTAGCLQEGCNIHEEEPVSDSCAVEDGRVFHSTKSNL